MNKESNYTEEFMKQCGSILEELYYRPMKLGDTKIKRLTIKTEKRFIDYLISLDLVKDLKTGGGGTYGIQLEMKGFEVFEKYNGWKDYRTRVVGKEAKIINAKNLAAKFWWLPIAISVLSLLISFITLFYKTQDR